MNNNIIILISATKIVKLFCFPSANILETLHLLEDTALKQASPIKTFPGK